MTSLPPEFMERVKKLGFHKDNRKGLHCVFCGNHSGDFGCVLFCHHVEPKRIYCDLCIEKILVIVEASVAEARKEIFDALSDTLCLKGNPKGKRIVWRVTEIEYLKLLERFGVGEEKP